MSIILAVHIMNNALDHYASFEGVRNIKPLKKPIPPNPRILIVKLWALGDILMATPILKALRSHYPNCHITWLADIYYADILIGNPYLDEVIPFDSGIWRRYYRYGKIIPYLNMSREINRQLYQSKFDIFFNLSAEKWWCIWFATASLRIGLFPEVQANYMKRFYDISITRPKDRHLHNSEHYVSIVQSLGIPGPYDLHMSLPSIENFDDDINRFLNNNSNYNANKETLIVHPGASQVTKCWSTRYYARLLDLLNGQYNIVITGSRKEKKLAEIIVEELNPDTPKPVTAAGEFDDIRSTVALINRASLVITGDTSVLHIASAMNKPIIAIYGGTRPGDNKPLYGNNVLLYDDSVECAPCYKSECSLYGDNQYLCMKQITPEIVIKHIGDFLSCSFRSSDL